MSGDRVPGLYAMYIPPNYEEPDEDALQRIRERFQSSIRDGGLLFLSPGCTIYRVDVAPNEAQMGRLIELLNLSDEERALIRAALTQGVGKDLWSVLADYLEEQGKPESARFREMADAT